MADKPVPADGKPPASDSAAPVTPPVPPKRGPGHRGADVKDTVAEMAAKAHEISLEAGSKMAAAMKDVINAAAGITGFVLESARDLVQYMVRRGQMTQEEADKLIRQAEEAQVGRPAPPKAPVVKTEKVEKVDTPVDVPAPSTPATSETSEDGDDEPASDSAPKVASKKTAAKPAEKAAPAAKKAAVKTAEKSADKPAPAAKKAPAKKK